MDRETAETRFAVQQPAAKTRRENRGGRLARQAALAQRMKATTIAVDAGHLSLVSHPRGIADLILRAAGQKAHSGS